MPDVDSSQIILRWQSLMSNIVSSFGAWLCFFTPTERKNSFKYVSAIWQEHWRIKETFESNLNCNASVKSPIYGISS